MASSSFTSRLLPLLHYLYSSSICFRPPCSSKITSKALPFFTTISPNCFSCAKPDGLQFHHFQNGQERDDHRVARWASLEKLDQIHHVVRAGQNLGAQGRNHLRHCELLVVQLDARNFLAALEHLLEDFHQIH